MVFGLSLMFTFIIFSTEIKLVISPSTPMIFLLIFMWITYGNGIIFSRIGGEEFAIILPNTNLDKTKELAIKLKDLVQNNSLLIDNQEIKITISIGLSTLDEKNQTYNEILKTADTNLYEAKRKGRNIIVS